MELRKLGLNQNIATPEKTGGLSDSSKLKGTPDVVKGGPSFAETLQNMQQPNPAAGVDLKNSVGAVANPGALAKPNLDGVKFSNHAVERMMSRGISFNPQDMQKLNEAVGRAAAKGSKDSLILMNDSALIVSVKNKTVVTVMDKNALKENVFTNIDSTIVM